MLFLLFALGRDRYALDIGQLVEVLPLLELKAIPQAPPGVAGLFTYHGEPVPVLDVSAMLLGKPSRRLLSTRLVLVRQPDGSGRERLLGLMVEKAIRTWRARAEDFVESGVASDGTPCLGPVATDGQGLIQRVEPGKLLSEEVRGILFRERDAVA